MKSFKFEDNKKISNTQNNTYISKQLDEATSRDIALKLLKAVTAKDVQDVLKKYKPFDDKNNWRTYAKWSIGGNQQSNPVGAFTELVINSMDAILMKEAKENGFSTEKKMRSESAPNSMHEATEKFLNIPNGRLTSLDSSEKDKLADKSIIIAVKRAIKSKPYPTYTIIDFGEGQSASDFKNTFVSVDDKTKNKEGIPFVQGKFHMGSTGVLRFCTKCEGKLGSYKFILSKKIKTKKWAWTLVRVGEIREGKDNPVVEYFSPDNDCVPSFTQDTIEALDYKNNDNLYQELNKDDKQAIDNEKIGVVSQGTIIKLYQYAIGESEFRDTRKGGVANALTISLIRSALPICIYDFDSKADNTGLLGKIAIQKRPTFSGADNFFADEKYKTKLVDGLPSTIIENHEDLGKVEVIAYGMDNMPEFLKKHNNRVFYTINGQTHATQTKNIFNSANLGDLENHVVAEVVCDDINKNRIPEIFMPNREKMADIPIAKTLQKIVKKSLAENRTLKLFNRQIKIKNANNQVENNEQGKELFNDMVSKNPDLKELFGLGDVIYVQDIDEKGTKPYKGGNFPSYLRQKHKNTIEIPINSYKKIRLETDVVNDYLTRNHDRGKFNYNHKNNSNLNNAPLNNGRFEITIKPWKDAQEGDTQTYQFSFSDVQNLEPVGCEVKCVIVAKVKPNTNNNNSNNGTNTNKKKTVKAPNILWVQRKDWSNHNFTEQSGARITTDDENMTIYVNEDNKYLKEVLSHCDDDESQKIIYKNVFQLSTAIFTTALFKQFKNDYKDEYRKASNAISAHVISVIKHLSKTAKSL